MIRISIYIVLVCMYVCMYHFVLDVYCMYVSILLFTYTFFDVFGLTMDVCQADPYSVHIHDMCEQGRLLMVTALLKQVGVTSINIHMRTQTHTYIHSLCTYILIY